MTAAVAAVGTFADLNDVGGPVLRTTIEATPSWPSREVFRPHSQLESLAVQDGDVRIEQRIAQTHAFDFGSNASGPFWLRRQSNRRSSLSMTPVTVTFKGIFCGAANSLLGSFSSTIGRSLDEQGSQLADAGAGPQSHGMLAKPAIGCDLNGHLNRIVL